MDGTYLLELFKILSPEEYAGLERHAQGILPHLGGEKQRALIHFLCAAAPDFPANKTTKTSAYQAVFPQEPFREGRLEKVMVGVTKHLKAFLLQQHYFREKNELGRQIDWAILLKLRGLHPWQEQALAKLSKTPQEVLDREAYHELFRIQLEVCGGETAHNYLKGDLNVPQALQSLDVYYHVARLELLNHYLLQRRVTNLELPQPETLSWGSISIPAHYLETSPVLLISYKISKLLRQDLPPLDDFQELSDLLRAHEKSITSDLLRQFFAYLRNICAFLINAGENKLLPLFHQLQRDNLERGYLYHDGHHISASAYLSVATGAIRVGNLTWAQQFVESHKGRVMGDNASFDLYRLNRAQCLFSAGDFEAAQDQIAPAFDFLNYTLVAKRLEIKILYELQSELLPYKASAFKILLTRASQKFMPDDLRRPNADFVNIIHQILRSQPGQRGRSERLLGRIHAKPLTAERDWLLEKTAQLR